LYAINADGTGKWTLALGGSGFGGHAPVAIGAGGILYVAGWDGKVHAIGEETALAWSSVDIGRDHTVGIKSNGTLWAFGNNSYGYLGDGTATSQYPQHAIQIGSATTWTSVSAMDNHTVALQSNGSLWRWGGYPTGELGDGTPNLSNVPTQLGSDTDWTFVAAGYAFTHALKSDGTLWAWGNNEQGQLGDSTTTQRNVPTQIGSATNWISVAPGDDHVLALKSDGTIWSWGNNETGKLGDGTTNNRSAPVQIGAASNWTSISAGSLHSLARKSDGTIWAWGDNAQGTIGDASTTQRNVPTQVGIITTWAYIAAGRGPNGEGHSLGIRTDGTLWAWGDNTYGQLGDNTHTDRLVPTQIGSATDWSFANLRGGELSTIARKTDGTLWGWGHYFFLDDNNASTAPTQIE
jgi:alpha-tubulin suppressor-like RCC1 family protein